MTKPIQFIYFDVGGVVILDFTGTNKWVELQKFIGINQYNQSKFDTLWNKYKNRICIDYDVDWLLPMLRNDIGLELDKKFSLLSEFVNRFEPNKSIWNVISYAKNSFRIGLLTSMYPRMLDLIKATDNLFPPTQWDVEIDSSIIHAQKPDSKIYQIAQSLSNCIDPSEILFVDNAEKNLDRPKQMGWQTFLYDTANPSDSSQRLMRLLQNSSD